MADATIELVIRATGDQALRVLNQVRTGMGQTGQAGARAAQQGTAAAGQWSSALGVLRSAWLQVAAGIGIAVSAGAAIRGVTDLVRSGIRNVEEFKQQTIGIAGAIISLDRATTAANIGERFVQARGYAEDLYNQILLIDQAFSGSAEQLFQLSRELINQGVILDLNNKTQAEGLRGLAEAIKVAAPGLNFALQANQAIRAIMTGQRAEMDQVVRMLGLAGKEGDALRERLQQAGSAAERGAILMEVMRERAKGFVQAGGEMANTLAAVTSTLSTAWNIISRPAFVGVWEILVKQGQRLVNALRDAQGNLTPLGAQIVQTLRTAVTTFGQAVTQLTDFIVKNGPMITEMIGQAIELGATILRGFTALGTAIAYAAQKVRELNEWFENTTLGKWIMRGASPEVQAERAGRMTRGEEERRAVAREIYGPGGPLEGPRQRPTFDLRPPGLGDDEAAKKAARELREAFQKAVQTADLVAQRDNLTTEQQIGNLQRIRAEFSRTAAQRKTLSIELLALDVSIIELQRQRAADRVQMTELEVQRLQALRAGTMEVERAEVAVRDALQSQLDRAKQLRLSDVERLRITVQIATITTQLETRRAGRNISDAFKFVSQEISKQTFDWVASVRSAAEQMESSMSGSFFAAMKGEFAGLGAMFSEMINVWRRQLANFLADQAMQQLIGLIGGAGGGKGLAGTAVGFLRRIFGFQHGGMVFGPTVGLFGEGAEPEVVSPVSKVGEVARKLDPVMRGAGGIPPMVFNINAVDAASFMDLLTRNQDGVGDVLLAAMRRNHQMARMMGARAR